MNETQNLTSSLCVVACHCMLIVFAKGKIANHTLIACCGCWITRWYRCCLCGMVERLHTASLKSQMPQGKCLASLLRRGRILIGFAISNCSLCWLTDATNVLLCQLARNIILIHDLI